MTRSVDNPPVVAPARWASALCERDLPRFDAAAHDRVVVVAAHPDDETIGAGGALYALWRAGAQLTLVVATDGEAAYPGLDAAARTELAAVRRAELAAAMAAQGLGAVPVHRLGLPDSALAGRGAQLRDALTPLLAGADAVLAPWPGDPHPDHRAVGLAAMAAAPLTAHGWSYPIWTWAWTAPDDAAVPWDRAWAVPLDAAAVVARRAGMACYASQTGPGPDGSEPVLAAGLLEHVDRGTDLLFREPRRTSAPVSRFADLYADGHDPWGADSWYERRKRAVVLAALPRERYRSAVEPGCGRGELTAQLAPRCDRLRSSDPVPAAVATAAAGGAGHVDVAVAALPEALGRDPVDLVVFSEVLYYLDDDAVGVAVDAAIDVLEPGGDLLAVHWRGWPPEAPLDAVATHALLAARPELDVLVSHTDEEFLLLVLRRR